MENPGARGSDSAGTEPAAKWDFVDFFAGCGGMSYGFWAMSGDRGPYHHVAAFDIDEHANRTYERNLGVRPYDIDLLSSPIEEIVAMVSSERQDQSSSRLVVIGCAPCQGFSSHRKKDPRVDRRNNLVARFAEIAVALDPAMIIMENVPDLLTEKHWEYFAAFRDIVEGAGYEVRAEVVNMAEYGVPQERFRAVVLAAKGFSPALPKPTHSRPDFRTVRDAIGMLPPLTAGQTSDEDPMHQTSNHRRATVELLSQVPADGGSRPRGIGPACLDRVDGFYDVYGRLAWDRPSVTITSRCRTPSCGRFAHPEQNRGLSVREAALLQGFPPDFVFEGPFDDRFKQIGNAVPPAFSLRLAAHIHQVLLGRVHADAPGGVLSPIKGSFSSQISHIKRRPESRSGTK